MNNSVFSTAELPMPFKVLRKIYMLKRIAYKGYSSAYIYLDLEGEEQSNYNKDDHTEIELLE